jgi:hypothetical protein
VPGRGNLVISAPVSTRASWAARRAALASTRPEPAALLGGQQSLDHVRQPGDLGIHPVHAAAKTHPQRRRLKVRYSAASAPRMAPGGTR